MTDRRTDRQTNRPMDTSIIYIRWLINERQCLSVECLIWMFNVQSAANFTFSSRFVNVNLQCPICCQLHIALELLKSQQFQVEGVSEERELEEDFELYQELHSQEQQAKLALRHCSNRTFVPRVHLKLLLVLEEGLKTEAQVLHGHRYQCITHPHHRDYPRKGN